MPYETVSEQLIKAINSSGVSLREIARETEINVSILSRFVKGERGINDTNFSELCKYLQLELKPRENQTP